MVRVEEGEEEKVRLLDSPEPDRKELLLCCCSVFKNETIKFLTKWNSLWNKVSHSLKSQMFQILLENIPIMTFLYRFP